MKKLKANGLFEAEEETKVEETEEDYLKSMITPISTPISHKKLNNSKLEFF